MPKFLLTKKSHNRITGPIIVTTGPQKTCPNSCPLRKAADGAAAGGCCAEHGFLGGFIWTKLDRLRPGEQFKSGQIKVHNLPALLEVIKALPEGSLWRHNRAGDLYTRDHENIDHDVLDQIAAANRGRCGFTYTDHEMRNSPGNQHAVARAKKAGLTINLSAKNLAEADDLADLGVAPVAAVLPSRQRTNLTIRKGRTVIICRALLISGMTCAKCGIYPKQRNAIVGLPAVGAGARRAIHA